MLSLKRNALVDLKNWLTSRHRKPLLLRGARQVGKSTLVKQLAIEAQLELIEINLEEKELVSFELNTIEIEKIISEIEFIIERKINPKKDLIFIDEIQKSKTALMSLRYFYERRPELIVIAAGSLLDFLLNDKSISFPVGRVEFYKLGPLTFSEFLHASNNQILIEEYNKSPDKISELGHKNLTEMGRLYSMVGGMPEVVSHFFENKKDFIYARKIQKNILNTYKADIIKYSKQNHVLRCDKIFDWVPASLGEKVKYSEIDSTEKSRDLKAAIQTLLYARVITRCCHTNANKIPLAMSKDESIYKLYFLDAGLASAMVDLDLATYLIKQDNYNGKLAEQFVAQHLLNFDPSDDPFATDIFYWLKDKSSKNAEVDFIYSYQGQIYPIEVKSGTNSKSKSLTVFSQEHPNSKLGIFFSEDQYKEPKKTDSQFEKMYLPFYLVEKLNSILDDHK